MLEKAIQLHKFKVQLPDDGPRNCFDAAYWCAWGRIAAVISLCRIHGQPSSAAVSRLPDGDKETCTGQSGRDSGDSRQLPRVTQTEESAFQPRGRATWTWKALVKKCWGKPGNNRLSVLFDMQSVLNSPAISSTQRGTASRRAVAQVFPGTAAATPRLRRVSPASAVRHAVRRDDQRQGCSKTPSVDNTPLVR